MSIKRVFLIVLDSLGAGEAPDSASFGDAGAHTLLSLSKSKELNIKNISVDFETNKKLVVEDKNCPYFSFRHIKNIKIVKVQNGYKIDC